MIKKNFKHNFLTTLTVMKNLDVILAVVGGAVAGAALGLLFAPKKGEDLRSDIYDFLKEKGVDIKDNKVTELVKQLETKIKH